MDQTPCNPTDMPDRTLDCVGAKTVAAKMMKVSLGRITCCLAVCADGTKLRPMLIFKGKPGGSVEKEFKNDDPAHPCCVVQENAWTDERAMLVWTEKTLKPHVETVPDGIVPLLLLDKHSCHCQGSTARQIENLGVEWDIVPGGCAGLVQPIDVGVGKPFKNRMRCNWEEWMMDQHDDDNGIQERVGTADCRSLLREWAKSSWDRILNDVVCNSWRHNPFSCFPEEPSRPTNFNDEEEEEAMGGNELAETENESNDGVSV